MDTDRPAITWTLGPRIDRAELELLCERLRALRYEKPDRAIVCDLSGLTTVDVVTVDALARLALTGRRLGGRLRFERPPERLVLLLCLTGLDHVLPIAAG
jgi:anti-anti-sigma regulatory factor